MQATLFYKSVDQHQTKQNQIFSSTMPGTCSSIHSPLNHWNRSPAEDSDSLFPHKQISTCSTNVGGENQWTGVYVIMLVTETSCVLYISCNINDLCRDISVFVCIKAARTTSTLKGSS